MRDCRTSAEVPVKGSAAVYAVGVTSILLIGHHETASETTGEVEPVTLIPGKISTLLALGPIATSMTEPVAYKKIPKADRSSFRARQ